MDRRESRDGSRSMQERSTDGVQQVVGTATLIGVGTFVAPDETGQASGEIDAWYISTMREGRVGGVGYNGDVESRRMNKGNRLEAR